MKKKVRGWKWWFPKLDTIFSALIRSKGYCEMCGSRSNQLQCGHVITRANKTLRWDILNALCLCSYCHRFKWHDNPLVASHWFEEKYPERHSYLLIAKDVVVDRTDEDYRKIKEAILNKDFDNLIIRLDKLSNL